MRFVWLWFSARNAFSELPIRRGSAHLFRVGQFDIVSMGHTEALFYSGMIEPPSRTSSTGWTMFALRYQA